MLSRLRKKGTDTVFAALFKPPIPDHATAAKRAVCPLFPLPFSQVLAIATKEIVDHAREVRSLAASAAHLLMGPVIVLITMLAVKGPSVGAVLGGMVSVFVLVSVFTGGMNVAMDILAGERERKSLLPLLLNPVSRRTVVLGKWLAVSFFSIAGVFLTVGTFAFVCHSLGVNLRLLAPGIVWSWLLLGLLPLALFGSATQLTISTACRTAKEAQTYLSLLIFIPMGLSMFLVFRAPHPSLWIFLAPIAGQQFLAQQVLAGGQWISAPLATQLLMTAWCTAFALRRAGKLLERDEIVYGR